MLTPVNRALRRLFGIRDPADVAGNLRMLDERIRLRTNYHFECRGPDGRLKWIADMHNRVVTAGLNQLLDATFKTGLTTPAWYVGLIGAKVTDAAITSGAAVLTSASNPFVSGDATSAIIVKGAGAAGADLLTTILTYTSAGQVTLAANAGTTVSAANAAWEPKAADTMGSHADFSEVTPYSNANRPTWTPGTIASGSVDN